MSSLMRSLEIYGLPGGEGAARRTGLTHEPCPKRAPPSGLPPLPDTATPPGAAVYLVGLLGSSPDSNWPSMMVNSEGDCGCTVRPREQRRSPR